MDQLRRLFELPGLSGFNIAIAEEGVRTILMLFCATISVLAIPFRPSESGIYCVHICVVQNVFEYQNMTFGRDYYYDEKCMQFCEESSQVSPDLQCLAFCKVSLEDVTTHECSRRYGLDNDYISDKKNKWANSVCPKNEISRQITYFGFLLVVHVILGILQNYWIYLSDEELQGLLNIWKTLTEKKICRYCAMEFITDGVYRRCNSCLAEVHAALGTIYRPLEKDQQNLKRITGRFRNQSLLNCLSTVVIGLILRYNNTSQSDFRCEVPQHFLQGAHPYLHPDFMHCINPDAVFLEAIENLMLFVHVILLLLFIKNLIYHNGIVLQLYKGIRFSSEL